MLAVPAARRSRLVLLAYPSAPVDPVRARRTIRLAGDLAELGHETVVVAGPDAPAPPLGAELRRVPGPVPSPGAGIARLLDRPSAFARWWIDGAVAAAASAAENADAIIATIGPPETALAAARLAQESGRPWIADLRDPWALDELRAYPSALHRRRDRRRMIDVLRCPHGIVTSTPHAARALVATFPELALKHIAVIPDGFDADDFPPLARPTHDDGVLRIVDAGPPHAASTATSQLALRRALAALRHRGVTRPGEVELVHAAQLSGQERLPALRGADLLFLAGRTPGPGGRSHVVPGHAYEYLAAGRPILAAVPDGDASDLVRGVAGSVSCEADDAPGLARAIAAELSHVRAEGPRPDRFHPRLATFERRHLTRELGAVVDRILGTTLPQETRFRAPLRVA